MIPRRALPVLLILAIALTVAGLAVSAFASPISEAAQVTGAAPEALLLEGTPQAPAVPWLLLASLLAAALLTLQAGLRPNPRAVRVAIRPPKHRA